MSVRVFAQRQADGVGSLLCSLIMISVRAEFTPLCVIIAFDVTRTCLCCGTLVLVLVLVDLWQEYRTRPEKSRTRLTRIYMYRTLVVFGSQARFHRTSSTWMTDGPHPVAKHGEHRMSTGLIMNHEIGTETLGL